MGAIVDTPSGSLLKASLLNLLDSLDRKYEAHPEDPKLEFCSAAINTVFFVAQVLSELSGKLGHEFNWDAAARLALELGDYRLAQTFIESEVALLSEEGVDANTFKAAILGIIERKGLAEHWASLAS